MLVLSRRPNEKIVFPSLGISVQIMRVEGRAVRIGIEAPPEVQVLRDEVAGAGPKIAEAPRVLSRQLCHKLRNRLNTACLGLQVLHRRLELGETGLMESTIFRIFNELEAIDAELRPEREREHERQGQPAQGRRALLVEDNCNESELLAAFLRMSGYEVDTVDDGLKAIAYLKRNERPDAVLLDMGLPRLDGPKTVSSIRCNPKLKGLKVFAVSGANRQTLGVDIGPTGVDRWFTKPVNAANLVSELNRELDEVLMTA